MCFSDLPNNIVYEKTGDQFEFTVEIVYNDIGYNDEPDITTE